MNFAIARPETLSWTFGKPSLRGILSHAGKSLILELVAWRYRGLADIVKLHYSADTKYRHDGLPVLALDYRGDGTNEQEAREDLRRIMFTFNTLLDHGSPEFAGKSVVKPTDGVLQDKGKVLGRPFWIWLAVPWLPPGCEVKETAAVEYQAVCAVE